jgi:hypothetical protein
MEMKETKEALIALVLIGKFVADRLKDGVQLEDAMALGQALVADGEFKRLVQAGYTDMDKVGDELKDFSIAKALALAAVTPDLVKILQGQPINPAPVPVAA